MGSSMLGLVCDSPLPLARLSMLFFGGGVAEFGVYAKTPNIDDKAEKLKTFMNQVPLDFFSD